MNTRLLLFLPYLSAMLIVNVAVGQSSLENAHQHLDKGVVYEEISESNQEFLKHQDSHAAKLEEIDLEILLRDTDKILHADSIKIRKKDVQVVFEDAWYRQNDYFSNDTRHSEWLYNMNIAGVKDSIKILVGHFECYQGEAEFQVYKYGHQYKNVEDFMTKRNKYLIGNSITKHIADEIGSFEGNAILHESYIAHESITAVDKKFMKSKRTKYLESIVIYVLSSDDIMVSVTRRDDEPIIYEIDADHIFKRHHFTKYEANIPK